MARPLRIEFAGGVYHVTSRGLDGRPIVKEDSDRARWTELFGDVAGRRSWRVFAWTLMDNHFHLFLETPCADLAAGMHDLNSGYATWFNRRHRRRGPLLEGRYKGILVEREHHYWELTRYIHLNPVRARMTERPEDYQWGSCRHYCRPKGAPEWLACRDILIEHGKTLGRAVEAYAAFLEEGVADPPTSPLAETVAGTVLGSTSFVGKMRGMLSRDRPVKEVPAARRLRKTLSLNDIERAVCRSCGVPPESLRARGKHGNVARRLALYLARSLTGTSLVDLGARLGGVTGQAASLAVRRVARERTRDRRLNRTLRGLEEELTQAKT
jgi:putative transposase